MSVEKHLVQLRRVLLYEFFISHFVEMAKKSFRYVALNQSLIYLKQASRLCSLLQEDGGHSCDTYVAEIDTIHRDVLTERNRDNQARPQLPRRESSMEISSKIKFRIKMSRSNSQTLEDPYTNISLMRQQGTDGTTPGIKEQRIVDDDRPADQTDVSPRFHRHLAPHNNRTTVKHQKSQLGTATTTVQIHAKHSPKSPRPPIKCVNFFDEDELSSGNNSPAIHISDFGGGGGGDDPFRRDGKPVAVHPRSPLAEQRNSDAVNKENLINDIKTKHTMSDMIQQHSDNDTSDLTKF